MELLSIQYQSQNMFDQKKKQSGQDNANHEKDSYNRKMFVWIIVLLVLFIIACTVLIIVINQHEMANFLQK
jgi:preprotein translocase subunit SecY